MAKAAYVVMLRNMHGWTKATIVAVIITAAFLVFAGITAISRPEATHPGASADSLLPPRTDVAPVVAFIGDSYTQGAGADPRSQRWSTLLAKDMKWVEYNFGLGGTGYVTSGDPEACAKPECPDYGVTSAKAISGNPDIVVIAGGQKDVPRFERDPDMVRDSILGLYKMIRESLPNARIIAIGPSVPGELSDTVLAFDRVIQESAASVQAEYISLLSPNVIDPADLTSDRIHVNNTGHQAIAKQIITALTSAN
jgi:lysophospholipase L1-like esterase